MKELGFDIHKALPWFPHEKDQPYVLVRVSDAHAKAWSAALGVAVRRCYVSDSLLEDRANALGVPKSEVVMAKIPDSGSTMAGDFGEILVYFYQASKVHPAVALGPKKWRLKQDRTQPAPHSDVVQFILPSWPKPSDGDTIICSEVKTKSTPGNKSPIKSAVEDSEKDRTSRLARTLVWLRERALTEDLGTIKLEHLDRFINATGHPRPKKRFYAVAVVCSTLVDAELSGAPSTSSEDYTVLVLVVPELRSRYTDVFDAVLRSVSRPTSRASRKRALP